jgi:hypothetical protein
MLWGSVKVGDFVIDGSQEFKVVGTRFIPRGKKTLVEIKLEGKAPIKRDITRSCTTEVRQS